MKTLIAICLVAFFSCEGLQAQNMPGLDASPMDVSFYPPNFAHQNKNGGNPIIKIYYSRPQKKGREIFGKLEPFGKVYRTGANESDQITFYKDVKMAGHSIPAGTYSLFTIPNPDKWTIILNKELNEWGAYSYDKSKDLVRFDVPVEKTSKTVEALTIWFVDHAMNIAWDDTMVSIPIEQ